MCIQQIPAFFFSPHTSGAFDPTRFDPTPQAEPPEHDHPRPSGGALASAFDAIRNAIASPRFMRVFVAAYAAFWLNRTWQLGYEAGYAAGHAAGRYEEAERVASYLFGCTNPDANPYDRIERIPYDVGTALVRTGMSYPWDQP